MALPHLDHCLQASSWRWLLLVAERHGLPCSTRWSKAQVVAALHQHLLQPAIITTIIPQQTATVQAAFAALVRGDGAALAQPFLAAYGAVRTPPNWYRGLAKLYGDASPVEQLFVLGLAYFDPPLAKPGVMQRVVLPAELLAIVQGQAPAQSTDLPALARQTRPGQPPDLAWHMAIWLATAAAEPIKLWRGGWLPPTALAKLNARMNLGYPPLALRSERKASYLAFLHYLARAGELSTAQASLALTPVAWEWLAAPQATRWQRLWQAWCRAPAELAPPLRLPEFALSPAARVQLLTKVNQVPLDTFTPVTQLIERLALDDLYGQWRGDSDAAAVISALCAGPLFWFGVVDVAIREDMVIDPEFTTDWDEEQFTTDWDEEQIDPDPAQSDPLFDPSPSASYPRRKGAAARLYIRLTPHGAWLLGLPNWSAPSFPKPTPGKLQDRGLDVILAPPTIQPLHLAQLAPLCQWSPPAPGAGEQQLVLNAARVGQAVANGLQPAQLLQQLTDALGAPISRRQGQRLRRWLQTGQQVRIRPLLVLETADAKLMGQLRSRKLIRRQLDQLLAPTRSVVHPDGLAALVQTLRTLDLYTQLPAAFVEDQTAANRAGAGSAVDSTAGALETAHAGLLWMLVQIYQGLGAQVALPLALPDSLLDALHAQLTFVQQATAESAARRVLEGLQAALRGYLRLPAWRMVAQQGQVLAEIQAALATQPTPDLRIAYWAADDDHKTVRAITPYALETQRGVVYLTAYCHLRQQERTFRVDRIEACEVVGTGEPGR